MRSQSMTVRFGRCTGDDCRICFNTIQEEGTTASPEAPDWVGHATTLPTAERVHAFHRSCLQQWFQTHNTCPTCRAVASSDSDPQPAHLENVTPLDSRLIQLVGAIDHTRYRDPFVYLLGAAGSLMGASAAAMRTSTLEPSVEWFLCSLVVGAVFAAINSTHPSLSSGTASARAPLYGALASYAFMILLLSTPQ